MATKKKLLQAAAGQAGGAGLNVEDVFSTYLTGAPEAGTHSINNGIDLSGEGGMVWGKARFATAANHEIVDTERGISGGALASNSTTASVTTDFTAFTSTGFQISSSGSGNLTYYDAATWTFRKHPDFFNVVEYTGDGTNARDLPHGLNKKPGFIVVRRTDAGGDWVCSHRSSSIGELNSTAAFTGSTGSGTPGENGYAILNAFSNDTTVRIANGVGGLSNANASGASYVAYIWAHNDGDGTFGPDGDQDIIKCGSYTGNGSSTGPEIDLGFEPQWLLVKRAVGGTEFWQIVDNMRGVVTGGNDSVLFPNAANAEISTNVVDFNATGFQPKTTSGAWNASGNTYIYIAIRRGPMAVPESATDVFAMDYYSSGTPEHTSNFPVDMAYWDVPTSNWNQEVHTRILGTKVSKTHLTDAPSTRSDVKWDNMDGYSAYPYSYSQLAWMWRRAPNFFDAVCYTGNGTAGHTVSHNLGVAPEMMWVKRRDLTGVWGVYHAAMGNTKYSTLEGTGGFNVASTFWNNTSPTESVFTLGTQSNVNASNSTYIAYLFATLDGISKVGSYTGNGTSQTIDCGFSSGARFVLIKRADGADSWYFLDTERGIVAGNDPYLTLNYSSAQIATYDLIDPDSSGFIINHVAARNVNQSGGTYIFYAIA